MISANARTNHLGESSLRGCMDLNQCTRVTDECRANKTLKAMDAERKLKAFKPKQNIDDVLIGLEFGSKFKSETAIKNDIARQKTRLRLKEINKQELAYSTPQAKALADVIGDKNKHKASYYPSHAVIGIGAKILRVINHRSSIMITIDNVEVNSVAKARAELAIN